MSKYLLVIFALGVSGVLYGSLADSVVIADSSRLPIVANGEKHDALTNTQEETQNIAIIDCLMSFEDAREMEPGAIDHSITSCPLNYDLLSIKGSWLISGKIAGTESSDPIGLFSTAAEAGNSMGQYKLGVAYRNGYVFEQSGLGVKQNKEKALYWLQKSADSGNTLAMNELGIMYLIDLENSAEAYKYFSLSARKGDVRGLYMVARLLEQGKGVEKSLSKAIELYRIAAEDGYVKSWSRIGNIFLNGREGIAPDLSSARKFYQIGADSGCSECLLALGVMLLNGLGGARDIEKATSYLEQAAKNGEKDAAVILEDLQTRNKQ